MSLWQQIEQSITEATGNAFKIQNQQHVGGGCINDAQQITNGETDYFVKLNNASRVAMFEAEAEGLREMASSETIRVPEPVTYGVAGNNSFIVMEALNLGGSANMDQMGHDLAAMHKVTADKFGWRIENTIGSTPQPNDYENDWITFWREHRLGFQLELAKQKGYGGQLQTLGERLMADFPVLFDSYLPEASMLHGDLWGGNFSSLSDGTPVIFDPAFYYGDREADIAMTFLFGGFGSRFVDAYNEAWPLDDGFSVRKEFYNLYHIINHANLFGGSYQGQAVNMLQSILSNI